MRRMNKPSADNAFALSAATRRRAKVRRAARFVYSIKPYFVAYNSDLRRFWTVVSFQTENTPCVIALYAVCTFFTAPLLFYDTEMVNSIELSSKTVSSVIVISSVIFSLI